MKTRTLATWVFGLGCLLTVSHSATGQEAPTPTPTLPIPTAAKPAKAPLSGWALEVAKLVQAGVENQVSLSFITNSAGTFNLGADHIITLHELGVGNELIQAMLAHDQEIASGVRDVSATTAPLPNQVLPLILVPSTSKVDTAAPQIGTTPSPRSAPVTTPPAMVEQPVSEPTAIPAIPEPSQPMVQPALYCASKQAFHEVDDTYPVREPNPVQLTAPIFVWRGTGRVPNTMVLEMLH